jgi:tRNA(adenine34) deaminase
MKHSDDIHYMQLALAEAAKATARGEVPVGAVLVLADGRKFVAHNAPISLHDPSAHAEMRVIREACQAVENYRLAEATLYVTLEPCVMCAGVIIHARIGRVVYGAGDPKTGAVESLYRILSDARLNHQPEINAGIMSEACSTQLKDFFRKKRRSTKETNG